jgi:hypothetical protein
MTAKISAVGTAMATRAKILLVRTESVRRVVGSGAAASSGRVSVVDDTAQRLVVRW